MLELSYPKDWRESVSSLEAAIWQWARKPSWGYSHEMLTFVTHSLLLWNCFFSHAYFLLLGQKLLGYNMTEQNIRNGKSDVDF